MKHQPRPNTRASKTRANTSRQSPSPSAGWAGFIPILPPVAVLLTFLVTLSYPLLGVDDHVATTDNPAVKNFDLAGIFSQFNLGMYAPITWLGYAIAHALGGEDGFWYHLLSVSVHTVNAALVYRLMLRLLDNAGWALFIALLFAVHPVQVESVAWVAAFSTPLSTMFLLLSLLAYTKPATPEGHTTRYFWQAFAWFVLACLSKSTAVVLALLLPVVDLWKPTPHKRSGYLLFFAAALAFGALTVYSRSVSGAAPVVQTEAFSLVDRFFMVCYTPLLYWGKLLLPLKLNIYYAFEKTNGQFPWYYFASPAILATIAFIAWRYRESRSFLYHGLLFYAANIVLFLPFYTVGTFELCADHYNYLAGVGIFYILIAGAAALGTSKPAWASMIRLAGALWMLTILVLSFRQLRSWQSTLAVFTQAIDNGNELNGKMHYWRGVEYGDTGNMTAALADFNEAIHLDSTLWDAYKFRGSLLAQREQLEPALKDLQTYLQSDPENAATWNNVAMISVRLHKIPDALQAFNRVIEIKPDAAISYSNRARLYLMMGDTAKAQADLEIAKNLARK